MVAGSSRVITPRVAWREPEPGRFAGAPPVGGALRGGERGHTGPHSRRISVPCTTSTG